MLIESRELEPGAIIRDKYRIVRMLGRGGMGTVYLADHILLGQQRALKFISGELSHDPRFLKRFRQEAQAAIRLRHPNVVEVVDLDQAEDGSPYIAMEYVDGPGLRQALAESPFGVERALQIARGIALGLGAAHANGIVHRDVKPENILLAWEGGGPETPKLLDFGIASMKETATAVSRTRGLMLTPEYAAPEQWKGMPSEELDGRVDLYALGGLLHEMLTGQTSFHSHNTEGWMYQHLQTEPVAPSRLRAELALWEGLDALVLRLLAKDKEDGPANVVEFVCQLDAMHRKTPGRPAAEQALVRAETVVEVDRRTALEERIKIPKVGTQAPFFGQPPDSPPAKSRAKYVLAAVALIAVAAVVGAANFAMHPTNDRLSRLKTKDWSQVHYDDTDFADCLGVDGCLTKKARSASLTSLSADDWKNLGLDNQVLQDCMGYRPCVERRIQADRLMATTDWQHADQKLLADCMH
jgi:serine/threonine protein kinase